jgi:lysophospholipase L1-like esterase
VAKIEQIEEEVARLKCKEDRHLVVMVGTNNIQKDGSEVVLKKFRSLIDRCKSVGNRKVTVVGIPMRFDLMGIQASRLIGVNLRLERMCRENGVEFLPCVMEWNEMAKDRVHFNEGGQERFARKIFDHCLSFLD